ncbi:aquaporin family protein [Streptococcus sp. X16XC17]|uniref:MIP/aquaporin family protein n=1 Tax=unclassified Streptococcus TaxID=2608887 RepID=UPI00066FDEC5|nr:MULTISPECIES: MIP/aquaporin family protein [unclassified Streptococcus]TCD46614.1 aquaporin family protein [Streptococcus sp. X16XC17]
MTNDVFGEFLGTLLLVLLGNGVVAGVVLPKTKNNNAGWIVITAGWAFAVMVGAYVAGALGAGHLNPAVSLAFALKGDITWGAFFMYTIVQFLGAMVGTTLVWLMHKPHYDEAEYDPGSVLASFSTGPAIRNTASNLLSEVLGTFVLVLAILSFGFYEMPAGLGVLAVAFTIWGLGLSLGGTTGYALNPARDLGPRIMHAILPLKGKGDSDWGYSWIPVVGPLLGAALAVLVYGLF